MATWPGSAASVSSLKTLGDEAHVLVHPQGAPVGDGDPRRLLAPVLERKESEKRKPGDILARRIDSENAALFFERVAVNVLFDGLLFGVPHNGVPRW